MATANILGRGVLSFVFGERGRAIILRLLPGSKAAVGIGVHYIVAFVCDPVTSLSVLNPNVSDGPMVLDRYDCVEAAVWDLLPVSH